MTAPAVLGSAQLANAGGTSPNNASVSGLDTSGANFIAIGLARVDSVETVSITDNKGNGAPSVLTVVNNSVRSVIYYWTNPTTGTGHDFTLTSTGVGAFPCAQALWASGVKTTSPFDKETSQTGSASPIGSGSLTPAENEELSIVMLANDKAVTWAIDNGYTIAQQRGTVGGTAFGGVLAYKVLSSTSATSASISSSGVTGAALAVTHALFKAASPAASAPTLSSPTVVSTGNTIATVRVTTDTPPTGSSILAVRTRPAGDPAWTEPEVLASPTATITSGASGARDFNLTGLTNGTALAADFAQTGSNVVSTASFTPSTVPGAPTIGTATAGNAQATVAGTAPGSNGGSAITGYRSTATPGGSTVTGASLPITHTGLTNGTAYTFTLAAQNANGYGAESAASNSVTPSAPGTAPSITSHPSNQTVTAGATATFSVSATGSGTLTYQWQRNGSNISGATSSSYTTPATTVSGGSANNGDLFRCVVTGDTAPAATSNAATLTVNAASGAISGTFTLPGAADRADKQEVTLHTVQALSALTVNGNGAAVNGAPASLAANGFFRLRFDAQSVAWYRVG